MVTAPKSARWFKLGFGLRNCSGWAAFDEMDIQTRPGTPEKEAAKAPPPIDAAKFAWTPCDLTGLLNRPLADEVDNDGKGGWTDQGPTMDLRNLRAGDCVFNNVAFRVEKGNACFIMKNKMRPSQNLPAGGKVDLKGKADVLAFLHSGGWLTAGVRHATYVVHYADGQTVEIPVIAGKNIFDWTTPPTVLEGLKYDPALGFTQRATAVAVPAFVFGQVWMTLWKNPHPDKPIASLEIKGANEGIAGLIAVSRGLLK
jgi:beta-galactosidase